MVQSIRRNALRRIESLENRRLLAGDVTPPPLDPAEISAILTSDISGDGQINTFDALNLINFVSRNGAGIESDRMDVNGRDGVTAADALLIINRIAREGVDGVVKVDIGQMISPDARGSETEPVCLSDSDLENLQTLFQIFNTQRIDIGATTDEVLAAVNATVTLADEALDDPSPASIDALQELFETLAADGTISVGDVGELRTATDQVLRTTGASLASIDLCLDGLDAISIRGISPEALGTIYEQTVTLLTTWSFETASPDLTQAISDLTSLMLVAEPNTNLIIDSINDAIDPDDIYGNPSNLSVLRLTNEVRSAAADEVLSATERADIGVELAEVIRSMGLSESQNSDLLVDFDQALIELYS